MAAEDLPVGQRIHAVVHRLEGDHAVLLTIDPADIEVRVPEHRLLRGITQGDLIALVADRVAPDGVHLGPPDPDAGPEVQQRRREAGDRLRPLRGHDSNRPES